MEHELKTWPEYFQAIIQDRKKFEIRKDDRGFCEGDTLHLREWCPESQEYTGNDVKCLVPHLMRCGGQVDFGIAPGFVVMSIEPLAND